MVLWLISTRIDSDEKFIYFQCKDATSRVKYISELREIIKMELKYYMENQLNLNENNSIVEEFKWA